MTLIDGNNLLYACHACAPGPPIGRHRLVALVQQWGKRQGEKVVLVFDGPRPTPALEQQMSVEGVDLHFSGHQTADDVLIQMIEQKSHGDQVQLVSSDRAIRHVATLHHCQSIPSESFVGELVNPDDTEPPTQPKNQPLRPEKPASISEKEVDDWVDQMSDDDDDTPPYWQWG